MRYRNLRRKVLRKSSLAKHVQLALLTEILYDSANGAVIEELKRQSWDGQHSQTKNASRINAGDPLSQSA